MSRPLVSIKKDFEQGIISKQEFIDEMHQHHRGLYEYAQGLNNTNISEIVIKDNQIIMSTRDANIRMIVDYDDKRIIPVEMLNFNDFERIEMKMVFSLLAKLPQKFTFMDIGGNIGWFALEVAKKFPSAEIHSFEPIPKTYDYLCRNIELNGIKNIIPHNFGFSNEEKEAEFYYSKKGSGATSLENVSGIDDVEKIKSKIFRLDDFSKKNHLKIDFIKCDVEGAELFVFKGGVEVLKKDRPIVFTEMLRKFANKYGYHPNDIIKFFKELGYSCFAINGKLLVEFHTMTEDTVDTNFIFFDKKKHQIK